METTEETGLRSSPSAIFGAATTCLHACFLILQTLLILAGACPASEAKITQQKPTIGTKIRKGFLEAGTCELRPDW